MNILMSMSCVGIIMSLAVALVPFAEDVSQKTLDFADSVNQSLDCAFAGVPLELCNSQFNYLDKQILADYQKLLEDVKNE